MKHSHTTQSPKVNDIKYQETVDKIARQASEYHHEKIHIPRSLGTTQKRSIIHALTTLRNPHSSNYHKELRDGIDWLLQYELNIKGIVDSETIATVLELFHSHSPITSDVQHLFSNIKLWKGDITRLRVDAIVNAANSQMLGCFEPSHKCIDNVIHASAGPQLRDHCHQIMQTTNQTQGQPIITPAYNLPSKYIIHTVGPNLNQTHDGATKPTQEHINQLQSCYENCLKIASEHELTSIAFCCISTGLFGFPNDLASQIAVRTCKRYLEQTRYNTSIKHIIFNVFTDKDQTCYLNQLENISNQKIPKQVKMSHLMDSNVLTASEWIKQSHSILISAGAGLSASAGLDYNSTKLFKDLFPAMYKRGHRCMYEFIGYKNWRPTLQWGYFFSQVNLARFNWPRTRAYQDLKKIGESAQNGYFVYTSNADGMFEQNDFDKDLIYTIQGDYSRIQCLKPCSADSIWPIKPYIDAALPKVDPETNEITDLSLVPKCPKCGSDMMMNVRGGNWFLEDHFREKRRRYQEWVSNSIEEAEKNNKLFVIVEVGCGFNTPSVVRWPMEKLVSMHSNVRLIRINSDHPEFDRYSGENAVGISSDAKDVLSILASYV
ncbi:appr-1-p processing enzyme family protein [Acrasis kona]|uniref:Appr-1-p processing enzyme family protein n=1 Tax=Acrasis kona TaxID=1008807 RepID=A0AAW2ZMA0_9EUKA